MKKFFVVMMCLIMTVCFMPTMAFADSIDGCTGSCDHAASIGTKHYDTLKEAFDASTSGDTIVMLKDFENANLSNAVDFTLKNGVTLDGNGHAIRGNSSVSMYAEISGVSTIQNVTFQYIHNGSKASQSDCDWYGWEDGKEGTKSAVYASGLQGTANIINCTFDNADWDAIQMTPKTGASIIITGNTFSHSSTTDYSQVRYIHIEGQKPNKFSDATVTLNITGNSFYKTKDTDASAITNIGIWYVKDSESVSLTGNYFEYEPEKETFDHNSAVSSGGLKKLFPALDVNGDELSPVCYTGNTVYLNSLQSAINNATGTIIVTRDYDESITIPEGKSANLQLDGHNLNGKIINNGSLTFDKGTIPSTASIMNNGTLYLSCSEATGFNVENHGLLNITYCSKSVSYNPVLISNEEDGTIYIEAAKVTFTSTPSWMPFGYTAATEQGGKVKLSPMTDGDAIAAGAVARYGTATSTSRVYFQTVQSGIQKGILHLLADVNEDVTKNGSITLYCDNHTYSGSLSCPEKSLCIYDGTAILSSIECAKLYAGSTSGEGNITVKNGSATDIEVKKNTNVTIEGGTYTGSITMIEGGTGSLKIKGGYFTNNPTAYLASGKALVTSDKAGFAYKVGEPVSVGGAEVSPAPDTTPKADVENIASDDKDAVKTAIESTSSTGLNAAAAAVAENPNKVTEDHVASGVNKVKTELNYSAASASNIKLVVQPYLDITAQSYTTTAEGNKELAVEITPKYNLLATKSDTDITTLNTTGTGETKNAVVIAENNILPVDQNTQVTITFQLPSGFITDGQMDKLFVVHTKKDGSKETYKANVTKSGENYIATFTTNGFSPFVFMVDSRTATVTFDGTPKTYVASNVGEVLPTSTAPSGKVFGGWTFEGISGTYTTLTDDLLTALNGRTVTATPYFYTPNYGGGGSTVTTPLDTAKSEASKAVSEYVKSSDYEAAEQAEIKAITEKAATDIKNAKTEAEVKTIEAAAKAEIDKLETAEEKAIIRTVEATKFKARSKATTLNGKKAIRVTWNVPEGMEFDGFEVYRSTEKYKGFGTEPIFITQNQKYTNNKGLEVGKTYYYKVRAFKYVNDEKVYTEYSYKAIRTVK